MVATVEDAEVLIGNAKLLSRYGISPDGLADRVAALAAEGKTAMYVAYNGKPVGVVAVAGRSATPPAEQSMRGMLPVSPQRH